MVCSKDEENVQKNVLEESKLGLLGRLNPNCLSVADQDVELV